MEDLIKELNRQKETIGIFYHSKKSIIWDIPHDSFIAEERVRIFKKIIRNHFKSNNIWSRTSIYNGHLRMTFVLKNQNPKANESL